jgi:hypothetical protein
MKLIDKCYKFYMRWNICIIADIFMKVENLLVLKDVMKIENLGMARELKIGLPYTCHITTP